MRVFTDRLINNEDIDLVVHLMKEAANESGLRIDWNYIEPKTIVFNSFSNFVPGKLDMIYDEVDPNSKSATR